MEIPREIRDLYKHWSFHTDRKSFVHRITLNKKVFRLMGEFAGERMKVFERKYLGIYPYTKNPTLSKYRFCNIYRELDRQTIEFHKLLNHLGDNFPLWLLNMAFCRFVANPETVKEVGLLSYSQSSNRKVFSKLKNKVSPKYGNAYIFPISIIQRSSFPTREEFFCFYLPKIMKKCAKIINGLEREGVSAALEKLLPKFRFNLKFHWTEILIDVAYQYPQRIDLFKKFPIGPGAIPTMKALNSKENPEDICLTLATKEPKEFNYLMYQGKKVHLSAENWEGIGCEFRKYTNLSKGTGRRRIFKPSFPQASLEAESLEQ